ncbi:MAG: rhodanese-like domain-containing protein [Prolixibacteraceae bacterium]|nr:rhodanese-like domain-containing protein [Prolixibacteraceae bacterium]
MASPQKFWMILFLFSSLTFTLSAQNVFVGKAGKEGKVLQKYIDPAELKKIVDQPVDSIWIIDVRSAKTFENGHIPTAKSFPVNTIQDKLAEIPKKKYLILYCTVGGNAQVAAKKLKKAGYKRTINWGGLSRWPGEKETGIPR